MRIIFLNKKLVEVQPLIREYPLEAFHGTNLLALYRILESGQLGSPVGRHGGAYERVGAFYLTNRETLAQRYAREASRDEKFYLPEEEVLWVNLRDADTTTLSGIAQALDLDENDLEGIYQAMASLARYYLGGGDYPPVVIYMVVENPEVKENFYIDEDEFRDWLRWQPEEEEKLEKLMRRFKPVAGGEIWTVGEIVRVASKDPLFSKWLAEHEVSAEQVRSIKDLTDAAEEDVMDTILETFPSDYDIGQSEISEAAYHLVAKEIYRALMRLADKGDSEAKQILQAAGENAQSFYAAKPINLEEVDTLVATVYMPDGTEEVIDLKDRNSALERVKEIMINQILKWAKVLREHATGGEGEDDIEDYEEEIYLNKLAKALSKLRRALGGIEGATEV